MNMPKDIVIHIGAGFFKSGEEKGCHVNNIINNNIVPKIKNLRENMPDLPSVQLMDDINIKPFEIILYYDGKSVFQKEYKDITDFEPAMNEVVDFLNNNLEISHQNPL